MIVSAAGINRIMRWLVRASRLLLCHNSVMQKKVRCNIKKIHSVQNSRMRTYVCVQLSLANAFDDGASRRKRVVLCKQHMRMTMIASQAAPAEHSFYLI